MKFFIKREILKKELEFLQGVVEKKSTIPVLSNILISSVGADKIRITGTDLDITIRCEAAATIEKEGAICIQGRKLFDIVRLLGDEDIHFKTDKNDWVNLESGKSKFRVAAVSVETFPEVPKSIKTPLQLPVELLNNFIQRTSYAVTNEQSRFTLAGAKFIIAGGKAQMIATDGHRLAYIAEKVNLDASMDVLIPKKALSEVVRFCKDARGNVGFGDDPNHVYFEIGDRLLISRKLNGTFPNWEMVIPKDNDKTVYFDINELKSAIRRVALMADERTQNVKFSIKNKEIQISAQSAEEGNADETIAAEYDGDDIIIGYNWRYVQDFILSAASDDEMTGEDDKDGKNSQSKKARYCLTFKNSHEQSVFEPENKRYLSVIMPLRN